MDKDIESLLESFLSAIKDSIAESDISDKEFSELAHMLDIFWERFIFYSQ
jgi:hypothetical protein